MYTVNRNIIVVFIFAVFHLAECQVCDGMTYHEHSQTCIVKVRDPLRYSDAVRYCHDKYHGGHLVYILDKNTDTFVKGLLSSHRDEALIGLHDHHRNGEYRWGNDLKAPSYFGWKINPHIASLSYSTTVVTKLGWVEFSNTPAPFICQANPVSTKLIMECPILEEDKQSLTITCEALIRNPNSIISAALDRDTAQWTNCMLTNCTNLAGYHGHLKVDHDKVVLSTRIDLVRRSDAGTLTCNFDLGNKLTSTTTCDLKVYAMPGQPNCSHSFNKTHAIITCISSKAYPKVGCTWTHTYPQADIEDGNITSQDPDRRARSASDLSTSSLTSCSYSFPVIKDGLYRYSVSMYPVVNDLDMKNKSVTTTVDVLVEAPVEEPSYFITNGAVRGGTLYAKENDTVVVSCSVHGGTPLVLDIRIVCNREVTDLSTLRFQSQSDGHIASMKIRVSKHTMNKTCICSAQHVSTMYNLTKTLTISLEYSANEFSEMITIHLTVGACFLILALGVVITVAMIKGPVRGKRNDSKEKKEEQCPGNEYVGLSQLKPTSVPVIQIDNSSLDDEKSVYYTIDDLPGNSSKRQDTYIQFVPQASCSSSHDNKDRRGACAELLEVPESTRSNYENCQLQEVPEACANPGLLEVPESTKSNYENCQPQEVPETQESEKDVDTNGYVIFRVLMRAKDSIRRSMNYQNIRLHRKRSSNLRPNVDERKIN